MVCACLLTCRSASFLLLQTPFEFFPCHSRIAYSNLRKYEEACDAYRKAIELEPNNDDYKNNLHIIEGQVENLGQQLFNHIAGDNMNFRNLIMEILSDPQMSMA